MLEHMSFSTPPLHAALVMCHANIASLILDRDPDAALVTDNRGDTAVHLATHRHMLPLLKAMVARHPDIVLATNENNETPLHTAAMLNHSAATRFLAQLNPATATMLDHRGCTPLCTTSLNGSVESAGELIIIAPHTIHEPDHCGITPLMYAAELGHVGLVHHIMGVAPDAAAVVDADDGWNALHYAVNHKAAPTACALLEYTPALATVADDEGRLPLHLLLEDYDCPVSDIIAIATALLEAAPGTACTPHPNTSKLPLEYAISERIGHLPAVILDKCPQAAFQKDSGGESMLFTALESSDKRTAQLLMHIPGQDPKEVLSALCGDAIDGHDLIPEALQLFAPIPITCWQYVPRDCDNLLRVLPTIVKHDSPGLTHTRMLAARLAPWEREKLEVLLKSLHRRAFFLPLEIVIKLTCLAFTPAEPAPVSM